MDKCLVREKQTCRSRSSPPPWTLFHRDGRRHCPAGVFPDPREDPPRKGSTLGAATADPLPAPLPPGDEAPPPDSRSAAPAPSGTTESPTCSRWTPAISAPRQQRQEASHEEGKEGNNQNWQDQHCDIYNNTHQQILIFTPLIKHLPESHTEVHTSGRLERATVLETFAFQTTRYSSPPQSAFFLPLHYWLN